MKLFRFGKDGGPESTVWGFWFIEIKPLFSIVLLCFENGTRDAYHNHAFSAVSWLLWGTQREEIFPGPVLARHEPQPGWVNIRRPSWRPIITRRTKFHRVYSLGRSWVLSFRGPWADKWVEFRPSVPGGGRYVNLTHGRKELA
jgi:hypothetical protein